MEFVRLEHFAVVGIEARTSNAREMTAEGSIGKMWARFQREDLAKKIPNRADSNIVALYTDYASDEHGEYTYTLGAKVSGVSEIPEGMVLRNIPTARYAVFPSGRGAVPKIVVETWQRIWAEPKTAEYSRSYRADFELYGAEAADPANRRVDSYIGVRDQ
jgi:predicted transcriptional regulator YdeE